MEKNIYVSEITESGAKRAAAEKILTDLPDWFGIPEAVREYVEKSGALPFAGAFTADEAIGFLAIRETSLCAGEIYVMGVRPEYHRSGAGRTLVGWALEKSRELGWEFLQVKTLAPTAESSAYEKTRAFYAAMGFKPLEILPLWDEDDPCLVMVRTV